MVVELSRSLVNLRNEVNKDFPRRDHASDGWLGDASHAARPSDHNPNWKATGSRRGLVHALDTDIDDGDPHRDLRLELVVAAKRHPSTWYVISNGVIYSKTYGFAARRYTGPNGHFKHVHVSIYSTAAAEENNTPWLDFTARPLPYVDLSNVTDMFIRAAEGKKVEYLPGVKRIQNALNVKYNAGLTADGFVGERTLNAYGGFEAKVGVTGRPRTPDDKTLPILAKGFFRVKA